MSKIDERLTFAETVTATEGTKGGNLKIRLSPAFAHRIESKFPIIGRWLLEETADKIPKGTIWCF